MDAVEYINNHSSSNGCIALTRTERNELIELIKKDQETLNNRGDFIAFVQVKYPEVVDDYLK